MNDNDRIVRNRETSRHASPWARPISGAETLSHELPCAFAEGDPRRKRTRNSGARPWHTVVSKTVLVLCMALVGPLVVNAPSAVAGAGGNTLVPVEWLVAGQYLVSPNAQYRMYMQHDGNLVLRAGERPTWDSGTWGHPGARAVMQGDGNLVIYSPSGAPLWDSGTWGTPGALLTLRNDGIVEIHHPASPFLLWARGSTSTALSAGESLSAGQYLRSPNSWYQLTMQADGNLVFGYGNWSWSSGTYNNPGARAVMQSDGNLVIYRASGAAIWSSGTCCRPGAFLQVMNSGYVVISYGGRSVWRVPW